MGGTAQSDNSSGAFPEAYFLGESRSFEVGRQKCTLKIIKSYHVLVLHHRSKKSRVCLSNLLGLINICM